MCKAQRLVVVYRWENMLPSLSFVFITTGRITEIDTSVNAISRRGRTQNNMNMTDIFLILS